MYIYKKKKCQNLSFWEPKREPELSDYSFKCSQLILAQETKKQPLNHNTDILNQSEKHMN